MVAGFSYFWIGNSIFIGKYGHSEWSAYKHRSHTKGPLYIAFPLLFKFYSSNDGES